MRADDELPLLPSLRNLFNSVPPVLELLLLLLAAAAADST